MLKHISPCISSDLLKVLNDMGHGDILVLADANFPGDSLCRQGSAISLRADGVGIPQLLDAVLDLIPLDRHCQYPVKLMQKMPCDAAIPCPIWDTYKHILQQHDSRGEAVLESLERFAFYDYVRRNAYAVVVTGERAVYANVMLQKGVISPEK